MSPSNDPLRHFVLAQEHDYASALAELVAGRKRTHWIWYVLPQLRGLGRSAMALEYGLAGREAAVAYLAHPLLGPRLVACVEAMLVHAGDDAASILGEVDAMKFRSCLPLFASVAPDQPCFASALKVFYQGEPDQRTLALLAHGQAG